MGRDPLAPEVRRTRRMTFYETEATADEIEDSARRQRMSTADFLRRAVANALAESPAK